jgi:23S rRNA (cytidine2498-2'-O)-methyltransferase
MIAYLAFEGFEKQLQKDLKNITASYNRLFLTDDVIQTPWAQNIWYNPVFINISSIKDAADTLKKIQRNWAYYPFKNHRRAHLIQDLLPYLSFKKINFYQKNPPNNLGSWTLVDNNTILAASSCENPYANGEYIFNEDKQGPPSRAYLKLWEVFTRLQIIPNKTDLCIDLGASPGSWTFVLDKLKTKIIAIDKAPLDNQFSNKSNIQYIKQDAFTITPDKFPDAKWIFSDIICFPEKLLNWLKEFFKKPNRPNFICTIKFKGTDDYSILEEFKKLPNSQIIHLYNNKNELTWINLNTPDKCFQKDFQFLFQEH